MRVLMLTLLLAGCAEEASSELLPNQPPFQGAADMGTARNGSFGNVGVGGGQDFAAFRAALDRGQIPAPTTIEAGGFFAEHFTSLPPPTCGQTFCLHGMLSVSENLARGGGWTLLQMAMNSPIDPASVAKPPLDIAVVLDHSGSMAGAKLDYAKRGVQLLVDALGENDLFTFIVFDDTVETLFGPARVTDKATLKQWIGSVVSAGSTNIYSALETGYRAVLSVGDETQQRRVIFLTDGLPTAGNTSGDAIAAMSAGYNQKYAGLTTIGLGADADLTLLRRLAERGGGNFYFADKPEAVTEIFTEELAFFVAPIAYDVELALEQLPTYSLAQVHGTSLWEKTAAGGAIHVPSVFLVSRTSPSPNPTTGGRRGGGSAIIAELDPLPAAMAALSTVEVAKLHLSYRKPGATSVEIQDLTVSYDRSLTEYRSDGAVEKNEIVLTFFVAFHDAVQKAQIDRRAAKEQLLAFQPKITERLKGWTDEDLLDDLALLQKLIDVLTRAAP